MTNDQLKKKYNSVFPVHLLYNSNGKTFLAGTQNKPLPGRNFFAYVPALDDFARVQEINVVAIIRNTQIKSRL